MSTLQASPKLSLEELRLEIQKEYTSVACDPNKGYHFHTGRLTSLLGYDPALYAGLPEANVTSLAGTGNPFTAGKFNPGETVVDIGSGAGGASILFADMVGFTPLTAQMPPDEVVDLLNELFSYFDSLVDKYATWWPRTCRGRGSTTPRRWRAWPWTFRPTCATIRRASAATWTSASGLTPGRSWRA
jgi:hypothetical protein